MKKLSEKYFASGGVHCIPDANRKKGEEILEELLEFMVKHQIYKVDVSIASATTFVEEKNEDVQ